MHQSSLAVMREFVDVHLSSRRGDRLDVLDVGAMDLNGSCRQFFDDPAWSYTGMDIEEGPGVDVVEADPYSWRRLASSSFDVVVSGQALEHMEFPWARWVDLDVIDAVTNWDPEGFTDDSDQWMDSVLVARKPQRAATSLPQASHCMKRRLLHSVTAFQARRRSVVRTTPRA